MKLFSILSLICSIFSICVCPFSAHAGGSDGGEHSIGGLPVDISGVSTVGSAQLLTDPTAQIPAYQTDIVPLLNYLEKTVPDFAVSLKGVFKKKWYFSNQDLGQCPGGARMVDIVQVTRACQNNFKVILDQKWLMNDSTDSKGNPVPAELKQKITILHEMLRNLELRNPDIDEDNLEYVVRLLLGYEGTLPDENTLAAKLEEMGFGEFMTHSMTRELKRTDQQLNAMSIGDLQQLIARCGEEKSHALESGKSDLANQIASLSQTYGIILNAKTAERAGRPGNGVGY